MSVFRALRTLHATFLPLLKPIYIVAILLLFIALFYPAPNFDHLPDPLRPYRPRLLAFFNSLPLVDNFASFDPDLLIRINQWRTGLYYLADDDGVFMQGLSRLTRSLETESHLTNFGRIMTHIQLDLWIGHRLGLAALAKATVLPPIRRPVFVVGMPRSGTTFLHNLLSLDTVNFRAPRNWEIISPLPPLPLLEPNQTQSWAGYLRFLYANAQVSMFRHLAPKVAAVHPIDALNAEECMPLLGLSMVSLQFNTLSNVSSYNTWMLDQNQEVAFKWHKIFLQALRSGTPIDKPHPAFLLKAPWLVLDSFLLFSLAPHTWTINNTH